MADGCNVNPFGFPLDNARAPAPESRVRLAVLLVPAALSAQTAVRLDPLTVEARRVANEVPASVLATPATLLRFEPRVDVQARNTAEGQADIAIRGGIFEQTAARLGLLPLFDPQTGHYTAEIPLAPAMLAAPRVETGVAHAGAGFNGTAGGIAWELTEVESRGAASLGAGEDGFWRAAAYGGRTFAVGDATLGVDAEVARSRSDGPVPGGDHDLSRVAARAQWRDAASRTDLVAGYQDKFFGWPNLYTPFNFRETEALQTTLVALQHTREAGGAVLRGGLLYRRNRDDYEVDRTRPGLSNPFQHETQVFAAVGEAAFEAAGVAWTARALALRDEIDSTALTFGRFRDRIHGQASLVGEREWDAASGTWSASAGAVVDDTDRDPAAVSPVVAAGWSRGGWRIEGGYAESTQVAGYTALNSNPAAGLFRGNPDLGRARTGSWELGVAHAFALGGGAWDAQAAVFRREDRGMADWTFQFASPNARSASRVDSVTAGAEVVLQARWEGVTVVAGYAYLDKDADYGGAVVDASYYLLNFPRQRATLAAILRPGFGFEVRLDNEWREQEPNALRRSSRHAFLSTFGVAWRVPGIEGLELDVLVENVWDDTFEEVPAVPAAPRTWSAGATWRW